jgi:hypothetical protein
MSAKGHGGRRTEIPIDYIAADTAGNRASRRLAARQAKAAKRGRDAGHSTGGAPLPERRADIAGEAP